MKMTATLLILQILLLIIQSFHYNLKWRKMDVFFFFFKKESYFFFLQCRLTIQSICFDCILMLYIFLGAADVEKIWNLKSYLQPSHFQRQEVTILRDLIMICLIFVCSYFHFVHFVLEVRKKQVTLYKQQQSNANSNVFCNV